MTESCLFCPFEDKLGRPKVHVPFGWQGTDKNTSSNQRQACTLGSPPTNCHTVWHLQTEYGFVPPVSLSGKWRHFCQLLVSAHRQTWQNREFLREVSQARSGKQRRDTPLGAHFTFLQEVRKASTVEEEQGDFKNTLPPPPAPQHCPLQQPGHVFGIFKASRSNLNGPSGPGWGCYDYNVPENPEHSSGSLKYVN